MGNTVHEKPVDFKKELLKRRKNKKVGDARDNFFESFVNAIAGSAFLINKKGTILATNQAACKRLGKTFEELISTNLFDAVPPELAVTGREQVNSAIQSKQPIQYKDECQGRVIYTNIYPILKPKGNVEKLAILEIDFTTAKHDEKALELTTHHLKQTVEDLKNANQKILDQQKSVIEEERLKVLLQMAGATAHELNQPLTALLGNIEMMGLYRNDPVKLFDHVAFIEEAGQRISNIVKKIQSIHHYETKPYDTNTAILNFDQKIIILSVEDTDKDFETINSLLINHSQVHLARAKSNAEAIKLLKNKEFDLIFLDYMLPDGNGLELLRIMNQKKIDIPVVVITGQGDDLIAAQIIQEGAYDYLPKSRISEKSISRIITNTLEKVRLKKEIKLAHKKMAEMSVKDELTQLYNRRYYNDVIKQEISRANRYSSNLFLIMADIDFFKKVNDTYGHMTGDAVLTDIGRIFKDHFRKSDIACRYGGEEFAVILPNSSPEKAFAVCERLREIIASHLFIHDENELYITISIGISCLNDTAEKSSKELITMADRALYQAKRSGRNKVISSVVKS